MPQFVFDQIPAGQLQPIAATDTLLFHGGPARLASVAFDIGEGTIFFGGHSASFDLNQLVGASANLNLRFDDGSRLLIGGFGADTLDGGPLDDGLFGSLGNDTLNAHGGNNLLQGNQGADVMSAEDGADTVFGGQGDDLIVTDSTRHQSLSDFDVNGDFAQGNKGDDTITGGDANDTLLGGQGNDRIEGRDGGDFLDGNLGNDIVVGGGFSSLFGEDGNDTLVAQSLGCTLTGGSGSDLFSFTFARSSVTASLGTITDWASEDRISVSGLRPGFTFAQATASDFSSALAAANRMIGSDSEVVVVQVGADVVAFFQFQGTHDADLAITLVGRSLADISAANFV
jgi:Ca2+-binding RTX toxin-like protein